jgi:sugar phosphate isomerase/epimerase
MKFRHFTFKTTLIITTFALFGLYSCNCSKKNKPAEEVLVIKKADSSIFFKLSLAQWSLHKKIKNGEMDPLDFAQKASELGFEGIEYVSQLYTKELKKNPDSKIAMEALLNTLKEKSETYNVQNVLIMVDNEGDLASTEESLRNEAVENHKKWVDAAAFLGCHSIRVNASGNGSKEEVAKAAIEGLGELATYAKQKNINVIVENHGGYSSDAAWLSNVMVRIGLDNCGTLPDFGNFCLTKGVGNINSENCTESYDIYKGVKELMPFAKGVSAKSYDFDSSGDQLKIDYSKMLQIVKDAGYSGFIGVEYEGSNLGEIEGIIATKNLLLNATKKLN